MPKLRTLCCLVDVKKNSFFFLPLVCFDLLFCVFYFSFDPVSFDLTGLSDMFLDNVSANDPATAISQWDE